MKRIMMTAIVATMILSVSALGQLIVNGDFESGNTGFTTDYAYVNPAGLYLEDPGTYTIGTDPHYFHDAWTSYGDNTSGSGNMLIVNAASSEDPVQNPGVEIVWEQTVPVVAGTEYVLTYYLSTCIGDPGDPARAELDCSINGTSLLPTQLAPVMAEDGWLEVSYSWNSGVAVSATITLEDLTRAYSGDDFAIDDISMVRVAASIEKEMEDDGDGGQLGEHIEVTLTVDNPYGVAIKVEDVIPDGLKYIPGTLQVDGLYATPTIEDNTISGDVTPGEHTITFDVQVVGVECYDVDVTNTANVYNPETELDDTATVDITLYPYEGFSKIIAASTEGDPYYVPMHKDVHWLLLIEIENIADDDIITMEDVVVKDNLGGDLEMHWCYSGCDYPDKKLLQPPSQTPDVPKKSGKTEKLHLNWDLDDLGDEALTKLYLEISTDLNPGKGKKNPDGHQEYTSEGDHDLNSGATLKFTDPDTGLQLSAHTCAITVEAWCAPDLIVTELVVTFASDELIEYDYTIKNIGCGPADGDIVSVQAYLSDDDIFGNAGDIPAGGTYLFPPPGTLYPGDTFSGSWYATVDATQREWLTLMVDWGEVVDESDETNNTEATLYNL